MIGNDIVDLKNAATESNWKRKGFLDKIFFDSEQKYILNSRNPFQTVWLLWSMKESAYKAYLQKNPKRFFNPKKIVCLLKSDKQGMVKIKDQEFSTKSEISENYIHTVAVSIKNDTFIANHFGLANEFKAQKVNIYEEALKKVSKIKEVSLNILEIKKNIIGIPRVYKNNVDLDISFSLSHHGNYGAYAILN